MMILPKKTTSVTTYLFRNFIMKLFYPKPFIVGLLLCPIGSLFADWPNWRGPNFNGSVDKEESYPTFLDQKIQSSGHWHWMDPQLQPLIIFWKPYFLSGTRLNPKNELNSALLALCADKETGEVLWEKSAGSGYQPGNNDGSKLQLDSRSNYSSPSPVVSENKAIFFYGNGDLVCFDHSGKLMWSRNIQVDYGDFCFQWTFSTSPTLHNGKLYPVLQALTSKFTGEEK